MASSKPNPSCTLLRGKVRAKWYAHLISGTRATLKEYYRRKDRYESAGCNVELLARALKKTTRAAETRRAKALGRRMQVRK